MEAAPLSTDEFIRIGDAARLLAFHLGQRFASNGHAHLGTARDKLLNAAKDGEFPIVAGTESWSVAASFPLPAECVHGLTAEFLAGLRGIAPEALAAQTTANFHRLFPSTAA